MREQMKKIICVLTAVVIAVFCAPIANADDFGRSYSLLTSNNPDCYTLFTLDGLELTVQGKNTIYTIRDISFSAASSSETKLTVSSDGFYTGKLIAPEGFTGRLDIIIRYDDFAHRFMLLCDKGELYFPKNSLSYKNPEVFSEITDSPALVSKAYLTCVDDDELIASLQNNLREISAQITKGASTTYEKAWLIYDWLCRFMYYDHDAAESTITEETIAISNTSITKRTVCSGYASFYCALLEAAGIDAVTIKGSAAAGEVTYDTLETGRQNHEWSAFYCTEQERWVYADACWGSENDYQYGEYKTEDYIDTRYFDPTEEAFALNHRCDTAQRRAYLQSFSEAFDTETTVAQTTTEDTTQTQASSEETQTPTKTEETFHETKATTSEELSQEPTHDNEASPLIFTAVIMSIGVVALTIALIIIKRNGKMK